MQPFVLRGFLKEKQWTPMQLWTEEYMRNFFKYKGPVVVRFGERDHVNGQILHDHKSIRHEFANFSEMLDWMLGVKEYKIKSKDYPYCLITPQTHWAYLDYRDILELLDRDYASHVNWTKLNVLPPDVNNILEKSNESWKDSTIWIGTPGAYTPCHYDTYGFNLHAQIHGYKRWLLFPPETDLRPTRLPYEESSVFSSIDIIGATLNKEDATMAKEGAEKLPSPYVIVCGPGDLLFVPHKWWHSVQCIAKSNDLRGIKQICVSVNKWFPTEDDKIESKKEALLKFMMSVNINGDVFNLSEHVCQTEHNSLGNQRNLAYLAFRINDRLKEMEQDEPKTKRSKPENNEAWIECSEEYFYSTFINSPFCERLSMITWEELQKNKEDCAFMVLKYRLANRKNILWEMPNRLKNELFDAMFSSKVLDTLIDVMLSNRKKND